MAYNFRENLLQFLASYLDQNNGRSPSFTEITAAMGISPNSKSLITRSLRALEKEKKISLSRNGRKLNISLTKNGLQVLGKISAGEPIEALSDMSYINLEDILQTPNLFALIVKGTSMIEEGILDGDIIICRHADTAKEGDIVVALIENEHATLKQISYKTKNFITLIPANELLEPKTYLPEKVTIQGIYEGLLRLK